MLANIGIQLAQSSAQFHMRVGIHCPDSQIPLRRPLFYTINDQVPLLSANVQDADAILNLRRMTLG